jgi:hypothetical protein
VADVDGDTVTLRFSIRVNGIPSFGDQVVEDQPYTAGDAVSLELPEAVGGNVALTYFLDGELPPGLGFNPTARTISGELSPNVSYSPEGYALTYRVAEVSLELPEAVGGNVALTYFLDGELPPGLGFNPTARTISGELSPNVSYSPERRWRRAGPVDLHDLSKWYALLRGIYYESVGS